jgi:hypothetical protein
MSFLNPTRNRKNLHFTLEGGKFALGSKLTEQEKDFLKQGREHKKNMIEQLVNEGYTKIEATKMYLKMKKEKLKAKRQKVETIDVNDFLNSYGETLNPVMTPKRRGRPPSGKVKLAKTPKKRGRPATGRTKPKKDKLSPEELQRVRLESLEKARAVRANNLLNKKPKTKKHTTVKEFNEYVKKNRFDEINELIQNAKKYEPSIEEEKRARYLLPKLNKILKGKKKLMTVKDNLRKTPLMKYRANVGEGIIRGLTNKRVRRGGGIVESAIEVVPTLVNYIRNYKKEKQEKTNRANQILRDMQSGKYMSDLNRQLGLQ